MQLAAHPTMIPAAFHLGGFRIDVCLDDTLLRRENNIGCSEFKTQKIWLDPGFGSETFAKRFFLCQMVSWIFFTMGEFELSRNDRLMEGFSHFLYQALTSMEPLESDGSGAQSNSAYVEIDDGISSLAGVVSLEDFEPYEVNLGIRDWEYCIRARWWGEPRGPEDFEEGDYNEIVYDDLDHGYDSDWDWDETEVIDYDPGCNDDYDPHDWDNWELMRMEREEEEETCREIASEMSDYSDLWARSEDDGWFYDDDD